MDLDKEAKTRIFVIIIIIFFFFGGGQGQGVWSGGWEGGSAALDTQRTGLLHH